VAVSRRSPSGDVGLLRSLALVTVVLALAYTPNLIAMAISTRVHVPSDVVIVLVLLMVFNQAVNWIIYGWLCRDFRRGYQRIVQAVWVRCRRCVHV
jgi:hypothetical protein